MADKPTVSFTRMKDGTREDYELLAELDAPHAERTADRVLAELARQNGDTVLGYKISRLQHGLQAATRARRDAADTDWVVAALLHDVGDGLAPRNHDRFAAEILRPYVREEVAWVVEHHSSFQKYYYIHHFGRDRELRRQFAVSPYYQSAVDFCERWDQASFDPDYPMDALESFGAEVRAVFTRKPWDADVIQAGVAKGLPDPA